MMTTTPEQAAGGAADDVSRLQWLGYTATALFLVLYLTHFYYLYSNAVDVPIMDEWEMLTPGGLSNDLSLKWLLAFHNEHRILLTKLLIWFGLKLDNWNLITQQMFNYVLFGGLLLSLFLVKKRVVGKEGGFPLFPAFMVFLLADIIWYNHAMAFQSQFHLFILFLIISSCYAFASSYSNRNVIIFTLLCIASIFTFSQGIINTLVLWLFFGLSLREQSRQRPFSQGEKALIGGALAVTLLFVALWFIGYNKQAPHGQLTLPYTFEFWDFFLNLISYGFGIATISWQIGLGLLAVVVAPMGLLFTRKNRRQGDSAWLLAALLTSTLAALAVISVSRGAFGVAYTKAASRYVELSFLLIPLAALAWWSVLREFQAARRGVLICLWVICLWGYRDFWNFADKYSELRAYKLNGLKCIEENCLGLTDGLCGDVYDKPFEGRLETARKLQLSFIRKLDVCR